VSSESFGFLEEADERRRYRAFVSQTLYNKINGIMNMIFAWVSSR
jgi:hypothetical protein